MEVSLPSALLPCDPPPPLRNGHLHTILAHFLPHHTLPTPPRRWEIPVSDGDRLVALHFEGKAPVVVHVFHGLSGCSGSGYMKRMAVLCRRLGWHCVLVNHRGCGPGETLARQPYHAGRAEDLSRAIAFGRKQLPGLRHLAVGFSLSGNALALLMSGARGDVPPDGAICVNAPLDLANSSERMSRGFTHLYDRHFAALCRRNLMSRHRRGHIDPPELPWGVSLRALDELYTARKGGFASREDYYEKASSFPHLHRVTLPTVLLTAEDDPIVDPEIYRRVPANPAVHVHIERFGGHMGFIHRGPTPLGTRRWLDYAVAHFLLQIRDRIE